MTPIFPWIGGKRRLLKHILPLLPAHTCYVEPFVGAGAVFLAKEPAPSEIVNDVNRELVTLYRVLKHHLEEFLRHFKWALASRQEYLWQRASVPDTLTDIQRAARFFYLQRLGFGGKVAEHHFGVSTSGPPRLNLLRLEEELSAVHLRLHHAYIECLPWAECVRRYDRPTTLCYLDPPYWQTEGYGAAFEWHEYETLATLMRSMQGRALLSIGDHPDIRRLFAGFPTTEIPIRYTVGQRHGRAAERIELLIRSWD